MKEKDICEREEKRENKMKTSENENIDDEFKGKKR